MMLDVFSETLFFNSTTNWIWTGEQNSLGVTPVGSRAFRYNINQLSSASPTCLTVALAA